MSVYDGEHTRWQVHVCTSVRNMCGGAIIVCECEYI